MWQASVQRVRRYRREVVIVLLLLISAGVFWFFYTLNQNQLQQVQSQSQTITTQIQSLQNFLRKTPKLAKYTVENINRKLPKGQSVSTLVLEIAQLAQRSHVAIQSISFSGTAGTSSGSLLGSLNPGTILSSITGGGNAAGQLPQNGSLGKYPVSLAVSGTTESILAYLFALEHGDRLLTVDNVNLAGSDQPVTFSMTAYYR